MNFLSQNVIITGNPVNPGAVTQLMLVRNKVLSEAESESGGIFTPHFVQVRSPEFELIILPDRVQFTPIEDTLSSATVTARLGAFVQALPYTPYRAVGFNFTWQSPDLGAKCGPLSRRMFLTADSPVASEFDGDDACFGSYFSKAMFGGRVRLTIRPTYKTNDPTILMLSFEFNYEVKLTEANAVADIVQHLDKWGDAKLYSFKLIKKFEGAL